jgi:GTP-binding protein HflX
VVDASDPRRDDHISNVNGVLEEIGAGSLPQVLVYNKIDRLGIEPRIERDPEGRAVAVWISAEKRLGLDLLDQAIAERISRVARRARIRVPASAGALRSRLYAAGAVRSESALEDGSLDITVELPDVELVTLARMPGVQIVATGSETPSAAMPCAPEEAYLQSVSR